MKFTERAVRSSSLRGFTLVEVLAALVFMAVLIPVTVRAVRVASQAGQVGERKAVAARIAERVLNESLLTGVLQNSASGRIEERRRTYDWTLRSEPWREDTMNLVTVRVAYEVQGKEYDVTLSTLFESTQTLSSATP
jgi:prepilin-type N-terminal cleavage/methylation domain-containing protein